MPSTPNKFNTNIDFDIFENDQVYDNATATEKAVTENLYVPSDDVLRSRHPTLSLRVPVNKTTNSPSPDGYEMIRGYIELVKQNFKNLMLTSPGEKMMNPDFGVGLRRYLFQPSPERIPSDIEGHIISQVNKYLPYISIVDINFFEDLELVDKNAFRVRVQYYVKSLNFEAIFNYPDTDKDNFDFSTRS
jgi:phage baseplate assembly protein W